MSFTETLSAEQYEAALALAQRRLQRSDRAREQAELMLDLRSRALSIANNNLRRRESELLAELEQDAQRLIAAQESAQMASFHVEQSDRVVGSPNLSKIIGAQQTIVALEEIMNLIHPLEPRDSRDFLCGKDLDREGTQRDIRFIERTGGARWLRWNMRLVKDTAGSYQGVVQDITEKRKLTRKLRCAEILRSRQIVKLEQLSGELAEKSQMLSDRVAELEALGANLKDARNRAISADQSKSQFLAMMSHDIRTPMNAILAVVDILATTDLGADQEKWLNLIRISGEQMLFLLSDIIEVARHQEIDIKLQECPVDLPDFLENTVETWRPLALNRGLELHANLTANLQKYIVIDPVRLRQVFDNLISNAIKYTNDGFITFTADENGAEADGKLIFSISDTGGGIKNDHFKSIFKIGHRITNDLNDFVQGSGLGLTICNNIITAMAGEIKVQSTVNIGSTFTVVIPCVPCSAEKYFDYQATNATKSSFSGQGERRHILVAEDVEANRVIVAGLLDKLGHSYHLVNDGIAAIEAASRHNYDLVLMDVQMPRLDGIKATQTIRSMNGPNASVPIIGLTAFVADTERAMMIAAGMSAVVSKPVRLASIAKAIEDNCVEVQSHLPVDQSANYEEVPHTDVLDVAFFCEQISIFPVGRRAIFVDSMISDVMKLKDELLSAFIAGDHEAQSRAKHSLTGLCRNFGLNGLAAYVDDFATQPHSGYKPQVQLLEAITGRTIIAIEAEIGGAALRRA